MKRKFIILLIWSVFFIFFVVFSKYITPIEVTKNNGDLEIENSVRNLLKICENTDESKLNACFKEKSKSFVIEHSAAKTIIALEKIYTNGSTNNYSQKIACHSLGHIAGEIDGQYSKDVGESLSKCTPECGNACYHGVLIGALKAHTQLLTNLSLVCDSFAKYNFPGQQLTACNHGLGHGLAEFTGSDTKLSLKYCDSLKSEIAKVECGSGVFMETIDDTISGNNNKKLPDNIHSFCLELNQPYLDLCVRNIGNYTYRTTNNIPNSFKACMELSDSYIDMCVGSLGADFFFITEGNIKELVKVCQNAIKTKIDICLSGAILSSLVTDPFGNLSVEICNSSETLKDSCLIQLASHLARLQGEAYRQEFCKKFVYNRETCFNTR